MDKKLNPIIERPHEYKLVFLGLHLDDEDYRKSFIEMHLKKGVEFRKLRFSQPSEIEVAKGFNGTICGMEILDIRENQWDGVGVKVGNFEQDPGVTFFAKEVIELKE